MTERRSLIEGVKVKQDTNRTAEEKFVFGDTTNHDSSQASAPLKPEAVTAKPAPTGSREPLTTRIRADLAQALKRSSLQRQLQGVEPNTVQDILEQALEPWLRANGYLH